MCERERERESAQERERERGGGVKRDSLTGLNRDRSRKDITRKGGQTAEQTVIKTGIERRRLR